MSKQWRCFFCDEVFTTRKDAWLHFGEENCTPDIPACIDPLRADEKARLSELREARADALKARLEVEEADNLQGDFEALWSDIRRYFGQDCNSIWLAGDRYKSALNRIRDLEEVKEAV